MRPQRDNCPTPEHTARLLILCAERSLKVESFIQEHEFPPGCIFNGVFAIPLRALSGISTSLQRLRNKCFPQCPLLLVHFRRVVEIPSTEVLIGKETWNVLVNAGSLWCY